MKKIRKGDQVIIISGKDRGEQGVVVRVLDDKVVVDGIAKYKKHVKANASRGITGGIETKFRPVHVSNVALFNASTGKADKVAFKFLDNGSKVRVFKSTGEQIA